MKENFQNFIPSAEDLDKLSAVTKERNKLYRTLKNIKAFIPPEIFRPKNQHLHTAALQRIHNEITRFFK